MRAKYFWPQVDLRWPSECWAWKGGRSDSGYGTYGNRMAHRAAYELTRGDIPPGLQLDHLCLNKLCVNPWHLEAVTRSENIRRAQQQRTQKRTHCPHGHAYTETNTYRPPDGSRACRLCHLDAVRRHQAKRALEPIK